MRIKALEPFNAYGPEKLMLFAGMIADIDSDFAAQLINEGKAVQVNTSDQDMPPAEPDTGGTI